MIPVKPIKNICINLLNFYEAKYLIKKFIKNIITKQPFIFNRSNPLFSVESSLLLSNPINIKPKIIFKLINKSTQNKGAIMY